jgi:hypothetical protein
MRWFNVSKEYVDAARTYKVTLIAPHSTYLRTLFKWTPSSVSYVETMLSHRTGEFCIVF